MNNYNRFNTTQNFNLNDNYNTGAFTGNNNMRGSSGSSNRRGFSGSNDTEGFSGNNSMWGFSDNNSNMRDFSSNSNNNSNMRGFPGNNSNMRVFSGNNGNMRGFSGNNSNMRGFSDNNSNSMQGFSGNINNNSNMLGFSGNINNNSNMLGFSGNNNNSNNRGFSGNHNVGGWSGNSNSNMRDFSGNHNMGGWSGNRNMQALETSTDTQAILDSFSMSKGARRRRRQHEPGGKKDPLARGLNSRGKRLYLKYLKHGLTANEARLKAEADSKLPPQPQSQSTPNPPPGRQQQQAVKTYRGKFRFKYPAAGQPGGIDDPLRDGLKGKLLRWYVRYLRKGFEPQQAREKAEEHRRPWHPQPAPPSLCTLFKRGAKTTDPGKSTVPKSVSSVQWFPMVVMPVGYPSNVLKHKEGLQLVTLIVDEIAKGGEIEPEFSGMFYKGGCLHITCTNEASRKWLVERVPYLELWQGAPLAVCSNEAVPQVHTISIALPSSAGQTIDKTIEMLKNQNKDINVSSWRVIKHSDEGEIKFLTFVIDDESVEPIKQKKKALNYQSFQVKFNLTKVFKQNRTSASEAKKDTVKDEGAVKTEKKSSEESQNKQLDGEMEQNTTKTEQEHEDNAEHMEEGAEEYDDEDDDDDDDDEEEEGEGEDYDDDQDL